MQPIMYPEELAEYKIQIINAETDYCKKKGLNKEDLTGHQRTLMNNAINQRKWFREANKKYFERFKERIIDMKDSYINIRDKNNLGD